MKTKNKFFSFKTLKIVLLALLGIIALVALWLFFPVALPAYSNTPAVTDYATATQTINQAIYADSAKTSDACNSILMTHGSKTTKAIVFFHGYISCPGQFKELGESLYAQGYNVYIPRAPYHGLKDKLTHDFDQLTTKQYMQYAETSVSLAHGLGDKVVVAGISGGGDLTSWIALNDASVDMAVIISPGYGFQAIPKPLTVPVIHIYRAMPSQYTWWDPINKDKTLAVDTYPGYTTHSLEEVLTVGQGTYTRLLTDVPKVKKVILVKNAGDKDVDLDLIDNIGRALAARSDIKYVGYTFSGDLKLVHDFIDPNTNPDSKMQTYQTLTKLITDNE